MLNAAPRWRKALQRITRLAKQLGQPVAFNLQQHTAEQLQEKFNAVEAQLGCPLPPSYREFLTLTDGCDNLFRGAGLLPLAQLASHQQQYVAKQHMQELTTPIPSAMVTSSAQAWRDTQMLCIGSDPKADTLFVLDPSARRENGEMDVIGWFSGVGIRFPSVATWLEFLADMLQSSTTQQASQASAHGAANQQIGLRNGTRQSTQHNAFPVARTRSPRPNQGVQASALC